MGEGVRAGVVWREVRGERGGWVGQTSQLGGVTERLQRDAVIGLSKGQIKIEFRVDS